jgi:hypothetical protein
VSEPCFYGFVFPDCLVETERFELLNPEGRGRGDWRLIFPADPRRKEWTSAAKRASLSPVPRRAIGLSGILPRWRWRHCGASVVRRWCRRDRKRILNMPHSKASCTMARQGHIARAASVGLAPWLCQARRRPFAPGHEQILACPASDGRAPCPHRWGDRNHDARCHDASFSRPHGMPARRRTGHGGNLPLGNACRGPAPFCAAR